MGDTFDSRKGIDFAALNGLTTEYSICIHIIVQKYLLWFFTKDELAKAKRIFNKVLDRHKDEHVDITWKTTQVIY